jgi:hypothetical protein
MHVSAPHQTSTTDPKEQPMTEDRDQKIADALFDISQAVERLAVAVEPGEARRGPALIEAQVMAVVETNPGMSMRAVREATPGRATTVRQVIHRLAVDKRIRIETGPNRASLLYAVGPSVLVDP